MAWAWYYEWTFAHRVRGAAAIFLRADADMVRLGLIGTDWFFDALFAQRAFCARLIRLRADADTVCPELPPFNLLRTERATSTCLSRSTRFVRSTLNSDTKDASPLRFAMNPLGKGL